MKRYIHKSEAFKVNSQSLTFVITRNKKGEKHNYIKQNL